MLQLFLNDTLVDLTDDSPIALTFQINNLAEVKNQQGNTSNQFKLLLTQRNRQILGYPDEVAFTTHLPYTRYAAKVVQDGMEIIPYGIGELNSVDDSTASITVLSGNVDFFDAIDGKIYDVGDNKNASNTAWRAFDHKWNLDNVVASQAHTEGWIWPVVDYGNISFDVSKPIDVRNLRPGFFLKTAIDLMVKPTGYTIDPESFLVNDPLYKKLIVQFANDNFEHGIDYINGSDNLSISVQNTQRQYTGHDSADVKFQQVNYGSVSYSPAYNAFIAYENMSVTVSVKYTIQVRSTKKHKGASMKVSLRMFTPGPNSFTELAANNHDGYNDYNVYSPHGDQKLSAELDMSTGQSIRVSFEPANNDSEALFEPGAIFIVTNRKNEVIYTQTVQCERIFPDVSQKDLLKDTLQRFGIICQTNSNRGTITLASFKNIVNNIPKAKDWSTRCLNQGKGIAFQLGGYAQINYLKYKEDENVVPLNFADGQINVDDKTLPAIAILFESLFAPTLNRPYKSGSIAKITKVDAQSGNNDYSISTQPRILIDDKLNLMQQNTLTFTDGSANRIVNDYISVPYFDKGSGEHSLLFEKLRQQYYPELERILQQTKKVVRWFMLTPRDILELDLLFPIYLQQDGAYYYINKIDSWRKGQPTKVELVKLG